MAAFQGLHEHRAGHCQCFTAPRWQLRLLSQVPDLLHRETLQDQADFGLAPKDTEAGFRLTLSMKDEAAQFRCAPQCRSLHRTQGAGSILHIKALPLLGEIIVSAPVLTGLTLSLCVAQVLGVRRSHRLE